MNKRLRRGGRGIRQTHFVGWDGGNKGGRDAAWVWEAWIPVHYHWEVVAQDRLLAVGVGDACIAGGLQVQMTKYSVGKNCRKSHTGYTTHRWWSMSIHRMAVV